MSIKSIPRPEGKSDEYQFFKNETTGHTFKVKAFSRPVSASSQLNGVEVGHTQFGLVVTTSMVDDSGKAIKENGLPMVDSLSFTITEDTLLEEGFDVTEKLKSMVVERINHLENRWVARSSVIDLESAWRGKPIKL